MSKDRGMESDENDELITLQIQLKKLSNLASGVPAWISKTVLQSIGLAYNLYNSHYIVIYAISGYSTKMLLILCVADP